MSILNTTNELIEIQKLVGKNSKKLFENMFKYANNVIVLCLTALLFNDYSSLDNVFYTDMKDNKNEIFENLAITIVVNHRTELFITIYKLFENNIVKSTGKNIAEKLYETKLFDPLVSDELYKFYIQWKLNQIMLKQGEIHEMIRYEQNKQYDPY